MRPFEDGQTVRLKVNGVLAKVLSGRYDPSGWWVTVETSEGVEIEFPAEFLEPA